MVEVLYANAPLTEVVAEIHWALTPLQIATDAAIDPFFSQFETDFGALLASEGFVIIENRVPDDVPRELLGHNAVKLFRKSQNRWPVYQIGPGVFTANIIPPYDGWSAFQPFIAKGLEYLEKAYPYAENMRVERVILRYLNSFNSSHGLETQPEFIRDHLGLKLDIPAAMQSASAGGMDSIGFSGALSIPLASPTTSVGSIDWRGATTTKGEHVVLLNLSVQSRRDRAILNVQEIVDIFDRAHSVISDWFSALIEKKIRKSLGEERQVNA